MTNYGTRAILALPKMPERQLRFLLALETFTRNEDGWREAGTALLARTAGLSVKTAVRARAELVKSAAIGYQPGNGRGQVGTYRLKVVINDVHLSEPGKVPSDGAHLSGAGKVSSDGAHLSEPERYPNERRKGTPTGSKKVPTRNASTSQNAFAALEPLALEPSALTRGRGAAAIIRKSYPDATDDEIEIMIKDRISHGARSVEAVLAAEAERGTLRLPCDDGPGRHSAACRDGDPGGCAYDWCECRCHTQPAVRR